MSEIQQGFRELVEKCGDDIAINEPTCIIWKADHSNCLGCPSELGCGKLVHLMLVHLIPMTYTPKNFEDHQKMHTRILELQRMVLASSTTDELRAVPTI